MAGLEFPTQKKPEAQSDESAFGGLPTPAWAMAKPKAASASKKEDAASGTKPVAAATSKGRNDKPGSVLGAVFTLDVLLALIAVAAFASVITLISWFWPELTWMIRRYL